MTEERIIEERTAREIVEDYRGYLDGVECARADGDEERAASYFRLAEAALTALVKRDEAWLRLIAGLATFNELVTGLQHVRNVDAAPTVIAQEVHRLAKASR